MRPFSQLRCFATGVFALLLGTAVASETEPASGRSLEYLERLAAAARGSEDEDAAEGPAAAAEGRGARRRERLWPERVLLPVAERLASEVARLRTELEAFRKQQQQQHHQSTAESGDAAPLSTLLEGGREAPAARGDPGAEHGRTLFLTMCAGSHYFDTFCGPFFASFERAYGGAAAGHRVVAFTTNVDARLRAAAAARFAPWGRFEELQQGQGDREKAAAMFDTAEVGGGPASSESFECTTLKDNRKLCVPPEESKRDVQVAIDSLWFPWRIIGYLKEHASGFCYAAIMDSDVLFVRPLGPFLPPCQQQQQPVDWDVAFTAYGPEFSAPWADDATEVGRTKNGMTRVNCGVVLLNLLDPELARRFMGKWVHVSHQLLTGNRGGLDKDDDVWKNWRDLLLDEFRGTDQAGLVLLLCSYTVGRLASLLGWGLEACQACREAVVAKLELFDGEKPLHVRMRALPARILNHPEAMADGAFSEDLLVVHLKGLWWRAALNDGVLSRDATRRPHWHRDALMLQRLCSETWQLALPRDLREEPRFPLRLFDVWPSS